MNTEKEQDIIEKQKRGLSFLALGFILAISAMMAFVTWNKAEAATIFSQPVYPTGQYWHWSMSDPGITVPAGTFTSTSDFAQVSFWVSSDPSNTYQIRIEDVTGVATYYCPVNVSNSSGSIAQITCDFTSSAIPIVPTHTYNFRLHMAAGYNDVNIYEGPYSGPATCTGTCNAGDLTASVVTDTAPSLPGVPAFTSVTPQSIPGYDGPSTEVSTTTTATIYIPPSWWGTQYTVQGNAYGMDGQQGVAQTFAVIASSTTSYSMTLTGQGTWGVQWKLWYTNPTNGTVSYYATSTAFNIGPHSVSQYLLNAGSSVSFNSATSTSCLWSSFNLADCFGYLFIPNPVAIGNNYTSAVTTVFQTVPLGYLTRLVSLVSTTSSSTLPDVGYTFPSSYSVTPLAGTNWGFSLQDVVASTSAFISETSDPSGGSDTWSSVLTSLLTYAIWPLLILLMVSQVLSVSWFDGGRGRRGTDSPGARGGVTMYGDLVRSKERKERSAYNREIDKLS